MLTYIACHPLSVSQTGHQVCEFWPHDISIFSPVYKTDKLHGIIEHFVYHTFRYDYDTLTNKKRNNNNLYNGK